MGGGSKQLKIPPGGEFGIFLFFRGGGGGSGQPGNPSGYTLAAPKHRHYIWLLIQA